MKRHLFAFIGVFGTLALAVCASFGFAPIDMVADLACNVGWLSGFTGHVDGIALAAGAAAIPFSEVKGYIDELQRTFENQFKDYTERAEAEQKTFGETLTETKSAVDKINERQDQLETKLQRIPAGDAGELPTEEKAQKKAFFSYVKGVRADMTADEKKALVLDANGEIIVPEEFEQQLYRELPRPVNIRGRAAHQRTTSNRVRRATMGELTVGWGKLETNDQAVADSMPNAPGEEFIYVEDLYGLA